MKQTPQTLQKKNRALFEIANSQLGLFTAKQAESVGFIRTNHSYHIKQGHWVRVERGIYRLALFPIEQEEQLATYALWSQNREGVIQGVYSHETALSRYELSDVLPSKLQMTVPKRFKRNAATPKVLNLFFEDLPESDISNDRGFKITTVSRTLFDVAMKQRTSLEFVFQAMRQAVQRGLIYGDKLKQLRERLVQAGAEHQVIQEMDRLMRKAA